jgi:hypothetical protein
MQIDFFMNRGIYMKLKVDRLREAVQIFDSIPSFATYDNMMREPTNNFYVHSGDKNKIFFIDVLSYLELLTEIGSDESALEFYKKIKNREINASANDNQQYVFGDESITFKHVERGWGDEPEWVISEEKKIPEIILIREYTPQHFYENDLVWITEAHFNLNWARRLNKLGLEEEAQKTLKAIKSSKLMREDGFLNCSYRFKRSHGIQSFYEVYSRANVDYTNTMIELGHLEEARDMIKRIMQSNLYQENGLLKNSAVLDEKGREEKPLSSTNFYWAATLYKAGFKTEAIEVISETKKRSVAITEKLDKLESMTLIRCLITIGLEEKAEELIESIRKKELLYEKQTDYTKPLNLKSNDIELYSNWTMALLGIGI